MGQRTYRVQSSKLGIVIWIILQPVLQFILVLKVTSRLDSFKHGVPSISEQPQPVKRNSSTSCISLSSSVFMEKFTQDASLLSVLLSSSSELLALSRMHDAGAFPAKLYSCLCPFKELTYPVWEEAVILRLRVVHAYHQLSPCDHWRVMMLFRKAQKN